MIGGSGPGPVRRVPERPLILLTNDDGILASGLLALKRALDTLGDVMVVAPDRNRTGSARSITMDGPLWVEDVTLPDGSIGYAIEGTPVDCVRMAALGLLDRPPDLIVSGHQPRRQPRGRHHLLGDRGGGAGGHRAGHPLAGGVG